ncbi:TPA: hypothetical protein HA281_00200 [Candidatus Woesearchaeota archaeon]|nr:Lrp/AsnC ligand binding domain-containing protein [Candidatus Woesearchaeota archaeon]HIH91204.1 hypothetical protein [Candidatus Woesearchaeota archaeon]HII65835.1 hypothetical protein [Candidatus Woesearchaeota archaeon]
MKDIRARLIPLLEKGQCTPRISQLAKKLGEPSTTIHYNVKKMEREGAIQAYKAVFNYKSIGQGHCTYLLINLRQENYGEPEQVARDLAKNKNVESVDICTGEYELIVKLRSKDIDEYYQWVKVAIRKYGFAKTISLTSLKQLKTEFVELE